MVKYIRKLLSKYFGNIKYYVTISDVEINSQRHEFDNLKEVDEFVNEINEDKYWMVKK